MTILIAAAGPIASSIQAGFLFADNFNRANESPIGGDWGVQDGAGAGLAISSNALVGLSGSLNCSRVNSVSPTNNQSAQCTMTASAQGGPCVRIQPLFFSLYGMQVYGGGTSADIYYLDHGGYNQLDTAALTFANGDTMKITAVGTAIKGYHNGVEILSATHATLTSGKFGILNVGTAGSLDNFVGNNL